MVSSRPRASRLVSLIAPMVGLLASQATAALDWQSCPPKLTCGPQIEELVAKGVERSESFRTLVLIVGFHPGVEVAVQTRRLNTATHAHSSLQVRGIVVEVSGRAIRQVSHVSGSVSVRQFAYARDQIGDIAHELAHVVQLLEGVQPEDLDSRGCWAVNYRIKVVAELREYERLTRGLEP